MIRMSKAALLAGVTAALTSCVPAPKPAPPVQTAPPPVIAAPAPAPALAQPEGGWEDWPIAAGDWQFGLTGTGATARYTAAAGTAMTLGCERPGGEVTLLVAGMGLARDLAVRTTGSGDEILTGTAQSDGSIRVILPASAGVLDRIGFSRGRFALANSARQGIALPAWPEIGRLTEFCRGG